jgi:glycosyltransferase involved in cell wall biosynthesis
MDISIIVPVYNVELYLERCLVSIFSQKFTGTFEVIAVDDASEDRSLEILYEYQKKEPRLIIKEHDTNKKQSIARATGMQAAQGDYIMHVDSDDWLLPGALESLHKKITETEADVVVFNFARENSDGGRILVDKIKKELLTGNKSKVQHFFYGASVTKMVKRQLTENMICGEGSMNHGEDLLYSIEILLRAKIICIIPEAYYVYFQNTSSITHRDIDQEFILAQSKAAQVLYRILVYYQSNEQFNKKVSLYLERFVVDTVIRNKIGFKSQTGINWNDYFNPLEKTIAIRYLPLKLLQKSTSSSFILFYLLLFRGYFKRIIILFLILLKLKPKKPHIIII